MTGDLRTKVESLRKTRPACNFVGAPIGPCLRHAFLAVWDDYVATVARCMNIFDYFGVQLSDWPFEGAPAPRCTSWAAFSCVYGRRRRSRERETEERRRKEGKERYACPLQASHGTASKVAVIFDMAENSSFRVLFDVSPGSDVSRFFFAYENVIMRGKSHEEVAVEIPCYLNGPGFDFYYDTFSEDGGITHEAQELHFVNSTFLAQFKKIVRTDEEAHEAISAPFDIIDVVGSLSRLHALLKWVGLDDDAPFELLSKAPGKVPEMAQFVMYRAPTDYEAWKRTINKFIIVKKAFRAESSSHCLAITNLKKWLTQWDA